MKHLTIQRIVLFIVIFLISFTLCIYPSFNSSPGVDCIAGCKSGVGFPLPYSFTHHSGVIDISPQGKIIGGLKPEIDVNQTALYIDLIFVLLLSLLLPLAIEKLLKKRKIKKQRE